MLAVAREQLLEAFGEKHQLLFADETCFTKKTLPRKTFASKGNYVEVDQEALNRGYRSALAAISTEGKVEHLKVTLKAVNAKKYMSWLRMLRPKLGESRKKVYLFVDNLGVHKTPKVMATYDELGIVPVFNSTYSPKFNPIEVIFSQVKRHYK